MARDDIEHTAHRNALPLQKVQSSKNTNGFQLHAPMIFRATGA